MIGTWIAIGVLALAAFGVAWLVAGEGRRVWTLIASALVFALAGYAWQGSPDLPGSPRSAKVEVSPTSESLIDLRRSFYNIEGIMPARFVVTADAFSRRGKHRDAAGLLRNGVHENSEDGEAWLALALALAEQTKGAGHAAGGIRVRACPRSLAGQSRAVLFPRHRLDARRCTGRGARVLGAGGRGRAGRCARS